jgi:hypothetical protein
MRNALLQLGLVMIGVTSVHAVKLLQTASIHTRIFPVDAAERVIAIQGEDSVKMLGSEGDYYLTAVNPGHWRVWVDAKKPYRDAGLDVTDIKPGTEKDLGDIILQK